MTAADDLTWPARTRRLQLRPLTASDAPEIWSWYSRPEVTEYTPTRYADLASFAARMEATAPSTLSVLHQERIVAHCFSDNEPSWRIMARIGMSQEALFREESLHRNGRWLDSMTWAMLATDLRPAAALQ